MAKNRNNKKGCFLEPKMTEFSSVGVNGRIIVGGFDCGKGGRPLTAYTPPLTPTTDRENTGVSTTPPARGRE